jgi:SAM-dependent methyltransferase
MRINVGCGATPTDGWVNLDNSLVVRVAHWPLLGQVLSETRILPTSSREFARIANRDGIRYANASARIPSADNSVDVVYSSHMFEHLDRREARAFLLEVRRVLRPGGVLRLAVPDLSRLVTKYLASADADEFVGGTHMGQEKPKGMLSRVKIALVGPRHHMWMYDGRSLVGLLSDVGFADASVVPPGRTNVTDPGRLDLAERADESVYVEAIEPARWAEPVSAEKGRSSPASAGT